MREYLLVIIPFLFYLTPFSNTVPLFLSFSFSLSLSLFVPSFHCLMHPFTLLYPFIVVVVVAQQQQHEENTPTPSTHVSSSTSTITSSSANSTITPTTDNSSTSSSSNGSTTTTTTMSFLTHFSAPAHRPSSSSLSSFHPTQSAPYPDDTVGKYGPLHVSTAVVSTPWMFIISIAISTVVLLLLSSS
ncbi:hypothetical protein K492DRAFT_32826 [Lichtheimia hyalospora FSU 10163]|nr:hypothetical protein K492DRAFT_32826 [Lichtheimia hyalospora FSU 10163]